MDYGARGMIRFLHASHRLPNVDLTLVNNSEYRFEADTLQMSIGYRAK